MKNLKDILYGVNIVSVSGVTNVEVDSLTFDSRKVNETAVFFALKGVSNDGHDFITAAIADGCKVFITEKEISVPEGINVIHVDDTHKSLGIVASNFYDEPSKELKLIGVTGTNGKTTIATLCYNLYIDLGFQTGLISTVVNKICQRDIPSTHTTPDPIQLNALLREMVEEGCSHCFMEVSSHALHQKRVAGLHFSGGAFTNITHDHLDYHKTFKEYICLLYTSDAADE